MANEEERRRARREGAERRWRYACEAVGTDSRAVSSFPTRSRARDCTVLLSSFLFIVRTPPLPLSPRRTPPSRSTPHPPVRDIDILYLYVPSFRNFFFLFFFQSLAHRLVQVRARKRKRRETHGQPNLYAPGLIVRLPSLFISRPRPNTPNIVAARECRGLFIYLFIYFHFIYIRV